MLWTGRAFARFIMPIGSLMPAWFAAVSPGLGLLVGVIIQALAMTATTRAAMPKDMVLRILILHRGSSRSPGGGLSRGAARRFTRLAIFLRGGSPLRRRLARGITASGITKEPSAER